MNFFPLATLSLLLAVSLASANPLETQPGTKITKNEAEHIALRGHQGARVAAARLETTGNDKVWVIEIAGGEKPMTVKVNAATGRIVPAESTAR
jgi:uncharacterized membrane protein YkoI